ncbi:MAG: hypothetical protein NUW01_09600 [Gemmatimonadaceae bacterium]|nr:hypothetical protein [Gemmatimonadaceae bacterium]
MVVQGDETHFSNVYDDDARALAYAALDFPGTYFLAYRDLPAIIAEHVIGHEALDFGCGAGWSTRFLKQLLGPGGRIILLGSTPDIYMNEWASFTTRDFPDNRDAKSGDPVRIVMQDVPDRRPVVDLIWFHEDYLALFAAAELQLVAQFTPLGRPDDGQSWISETAIAPWVINVLRDSQSMTR